MDTKESKIKKYCCLYVSDFHLEMILLPYIVRNIENANTIILTEYNLKSSVRQVLERTNLNQRHKEYIKKLNWNNKEDLSLSKDKRNIIIINGNLSFMEEKINLINEIKNENITDVVECYNISKLKNFNINKNYDVFLNTYKVGGSELEHY